MSGSLAGYSGASVYMSWVPGIVELVCTCPGSLGMVPLVELVCTCHVLGPWYSRAGVYMSWVPGIVELVCACPGSLV